MTSVQWDGKVLRFLVKPEDGVAIPYSMLLTGPGKAELRRQNELDDFVQMMLKR